MTPLDVTIPTFRQFDTEVRHCLEAIVRTSVPERVWKQATLPIRLGGLGLQQASRTVAAAFIGS